MNTLIYCRDEYMVWSDTENGLIYRAKLDGDMLEVLVDSNINVVGKLYIEEV